MDARRYSALVESCSQTVESGMALGLPTVASALVTMAAELAVEVADGGVTWASSEESYARHLLACCPCSGVSLYAVVWRRGQVSTIHDHGTWGAVAVVSGRLREERWCGGGVEPLCALGNGELNPGQVATFVNETEYVHRVEAVDFTLSLHLYGDPVASYHTYDLATGARTFVTAT